MIKKNETVYLRDGSKVNYNYEIEKDKHLVEVYMTYYGYEDEVFEELGGELIVDKVYRKAPTTVYSKEIKNLENRKQELAKEVGKLRNEQLDITRYLDRKTDLSKGFINKKELIEANSVAFFVKGSLMPTILDKKQMRGIKIGFEISIFDNEERAWGYKLYESYSPYSEYIVDHESNILIDKTQEELDILITKRIKSINDFTKIYRGYWEQINDKYLTKEALEYKNKLIVDAKSRVKADTIKKINELKSKLEALENTASTLSK